MNSSVHAPGTSLAVRGVPDSGFYLAFAVASAAIVFAGFSRSYYLKAYFNTPRLPILFHIHGALFTLWVLYFVAQTWLVSDGRFNLHRQMGMAGALLASVMVVLGVAVAFVSGSMGHFSKIPGATDPAQACLFSLFDLTLFGALVWAGFLWRFNPAAHSRLMLLSMAVALLPSAIGGLCNFKPAIAAPMIFAFMLAGPIYDLVTRRKIHPVYLAGAAILLLTGPPVRLLLGRTALWHRLFTDVIDFGS